MNLGLLMFAVTLITQPVAQLLEKHGMNSVGAITGLGDGGTGLVSKAWLMVTNPFVVGGQRLAAKVRCPAWILLFLVLVPYVGLMWKYGVIPSILG